MHLMPGLIHCIDGVVLMHHAGYLSDTASSQLQQLFDALDREHPGDPVHYKDLFFEDKDLNQVDDGNMVCIHHACDLQQR